MNHKYFLNISLTVLLLFFTTYSFLLFSTLLFRIANPIKTAYFSKLFLSWDKVIFQTNPGIWMINHFSGTFIETVLLWTYNNVGLILSTSSFILIFFQKNSCQKINLIIFYIMDDSSTVLVFLPSYFSSSHVSL